MEVQGSRRTCSPWGKKHFLAPCTGGYDQEVNGTFAIMKISFGKTLFLDLTKFFQEC